MQTGGLKNTGVEARYTKFNSDGKDETRNNGHFGKRV
jgi:hypothetical protein